MKYCWNKGKFLFENYNCVVYENYKVMYCEIYCTPDKKLVCTLQMSGV